MTFESHWFGGAANTLKTSRWAVLLARILGRRIEGEDMGRRVAGYEWRGRLYLTEFEQRDADSH